VVIVYVLLFSLNRLCVQFGLVSLKEMLCLCSCILEYVVFDFEFSEFVFEFEFVGFVFCLFVCKNKIRAYLLPLLHVPKKTSFSVTECLFCVPHVKKLRLVLTSFL